MTRIPEPANTNPVSVSEEPSVPELSATEKASATAAGIRDRIGEVIRGKFEFLEKVVAGFVAGGHILLEDLPGTGKTTVGRVLARIIDGASFRRIQFTPDLLPYDITGVDVWDEGTKDFSFRPGPLFAHVVLADEINRTTPKVQSALLEAMAENQVTVGNVSRPLPEPFIVLATQNPIESEGTYVLPEAQKDRFMMRLSPGYPDRDTEYAIVRDDPSHNALPTLEPACSIDDAVALRVAAMKVFMDDRLSRCTVDIAASLRDHPGVILGVSPRGALMLSSAAKALALVRGRDFVVDQDLVDLASEVYAHRLRIRPGGPTAEPLVREMAEREVGKIRHG
jgi:MoxR-like ATPase